MDLQPILWSGEDTTHEDSQPGAADTLCRRCQEDQGVVLSTSGIAGLRRPPENPAVDPAGNSPNGKERLASAWSVLHRTREELGCARRLKDWGEDLRQVERSVLACEAAVRAIRRALLLAAMGVAPRRVSSQGLRSEGFRLDTPSLLSDAPHPLAWVAGNKVEELNATGQQELVKFIRRVLDVIETMMMVIERADSDRLQREARERMKRALEIVAQLTPRVTDSALVQRIQTFVAYYAGMLEAKELTADRSGPHISGIITSDRTTSIGG